MKNQSLLHRFSYDSSFWPLRHLLFWFFVYTDEFLSIIGITPEYETYSDVFAIFLLDAALVYINLYILLPFFWNRKKYIGYFLLTALTLGINVYISLQSSLADYCEECEEILDASMILSDFISVLFSTGSILFMAVSIKLIKDYIARERKQQALKEQQAKLELQLLQDQVNPHFLFNSLNNLYILSKTDPKKTPELIMELSELMRYQTYYASQDQVELQHEISFLKSYLNMAKLRSENLAWNISEDDRLNHMSIPPLLFLPLVENAIKYGQTLDEDDPYQINISWSATGNKLTFQCVNTIGDAAQHHDTSKDPVHRGQGLANTEKRLSLLYPKQHRLTTKSEDNQFSVYLEIHGIIEMLDR